MITKFCTFLAISLFALPTLSAPAFADVDRDSGNYIVEGCNAISRSYLVAPPNDILKISQGWECYGAIHGVADTFEALSKLPDEFEIFYNRCVNAGAASKVFERRIDFIILHERLGLLAMEVKGGKIRIGKDGGFEQYHYNAREWHSIDPFTQVKVALLELIKTSKADGAKYWIPDDICVLFPRTTRHDLTDKPQSLPAGTLCADDLPLLINLIPTFFSKNRKGQAWKRDEFIDMRRRLSVGMDGAPALKVSQKPSEPYRKDPEKTSSLEIQRLTEMRPCKYRDLK